MGVETETVRPGVFTRTALHLLPPSETEEYLGRYAPILTDLTGKDVTSDLESRGFEALKYLSPRTGEFEPGYEAFLKDRLCHTPDRIGELEIPEPLRGGLRHTVHIMALPNGMGHIRPSEALARTAMLLPGAGPDSVIRTYVGIGVPGLRNAIPVMEAHSQDGLRHYIHASLESGVEKGMVAREHVASLLDRPLPSSLNTFLKTAFPQMYKKALEGSTQDGTPSDVKFRRLVSRIMFQREFSSYLASLTQAYGKLDNIIVHPIFNYVMPPGENARAVGTDYVVAPDWHIPDEGFPVYVKTPEAKAMLDAFWEPTGTYDPARVIVTEGFPGCPSMYDVTAISARRSESLSRGVNPTIVMLASGVAPVQLGIFAETVLANTERLDRGEMDIVIQAGYGELGELTRNVLMSQLADLAKEHPEAAKHVVIHSAPTTNAAVDFFEALSWSEMPLVLHVKGSEVVGFASNGNIPLIPSGAVGRHEQFNILQSLREGAPVYLMPRIHGEILEFARHNLPHGEFERLLPVFGQSYCRDFGDALEKAKGYIASGDVTPINRSMLLDVLADAERHWVAV